MNVCDMTSCWTPSILTKDSNKIEWLLRPHTHSLPSLTHKKRNNSHAHMLSLALSLSFSLTHTHKHAHLLSYGVATISRLLKIIGLFCKRVLYKRRHSAKETYNFKEPTNCTHHEASGETAFRNKDLFLSLKENFNFLPVNPTHIINRRKCKQIYTKNYCSLTESKRSGCLCHEERDILLSLEKLFFYLALTHRK